MDNFKAKHGKAYCGESPQDRVYMAPCTQHKKEVLLHKNVVTMHTSNYTEQHNCKCMSLTEELKLGSKTQSWRSS